MQDELNTKLRCQSRCSSNLSSNPKVKGHLLAEKSSQLTCKAHEVHTKFSIVKLVHLLPAAELYSISDEMSRVTFSIVTRSIQALVGLVIFLHPVGQMSPPAALILASSNPSLMSQCTKTVVDTNL